MRKAALSLLLLLAPLAAYAQTIPTVTCSGCESLNDFGNYGAAVLYQAVGVTGPMVGSDRIWVRNPVTGRRAFVDMDLPMRIVMLYGFSAPIPDLTRQEVNVTWDNGAASAAYELPVEVIDAIGDSLESEFLIHQNETPATPEQEMPAPEFDALPGFNGEPWRYQNLPLIPYTLMNNGWEFNVQYVSGSATPVVEVVECAWHSGC